ncbi:MAG TPA: beta galactosidase jelly roll domain-containing protein [Opitutaceae bacterium]|nr:beta galactosidase jelly roll domain-containing protein [Opitutaceae bacterium]
MPIAPTRRPFVRPLLRGAFCLALLALGCGHALPAQSPFGASAETTKRVVRLDGTWRFAVGDDPARAAEEFDDSRWAKIEVPATWQDEGYRDYSGFAWYRKTFSMPSGYENRSLILSLGRIDDTDEVFVNGRRVGGLGQFPPEYRSAYDERRVYVVPPEILHPKEDNVVAVRVFDGGGVGGIVRGRIGLYTGYPLPAGLALDGEWKFAVGDNPAWKEPACDETAFQPILVPSAWEHAGHPDLDGYGWYRKTFRVAQSLEEKTLVLVLGKIDDYDEVFLNGVAIGRSGRVDDPVQRGEDRTYSLNRAYNFPASLLRETNVIAVRVCDTHGLGGIYEGPIGILTQSQFARYWDNRRQRPGETLYRLFRSED